MQRNPTSGEHDGAADPAPIRPALLWLTALVVALVVALLLPATLDWTVRVAAGWDAAMLAVLGRMWALILRSDAAATRRRAATADPGRAGLLAIELLASLAGLAAAIVLIRRPEDFAPREQAGWLIGLGVVAVAAAWLLAHMAFTLHYAHLYYRDRGRPGSFILHRRPAGRPRLRLLLVHDRHDLPDRRRDDHRAGPAPGHARARPPGLRLQHAESWPWPSMSSSATSDEPAATAARPRRHRIRRGRAKATIAALPQHAGQAAVHLAGCTAAPAAAWVRRQARRLNWRIEGGVGRAAE